MKRLYFLVGLLLVPMILFSQSLEELKQRARAAGYSESQIERLIEQASKSSGRQLSNTQPAEIESEITGLATQNVFINSDSVFSPVIAAPLNEKFGVDIFASQPTTFEPNDYGPVPDDYVVGPGDVLQISVWGQTEFYHKGEVNRRGQIQIPNVGLVSVSGLSLLNAKNVIKERVGRSFSSIKTGASDFDVTVFEIRSIRVFIGGFVKVPGAYKLSATSSILSVIYAAGGITSKGNFRKIKILRENGTEQIVDLYPYLTGHFPQQLIRLENNDMVIVDGEDLAVKIEGAVNRSGIYDLLADETVEDLLKFAGGPMADAWLGNVEVTRIVPGKGLKTVSINMEKEGQNIPLQNGDVIVVTATSKTPYNTLKITGAVRQPGYLAYQPGDRILDVIKKVGGVEEWAYLNRAELITTNPDSSQQIQAVKLNEALAGNPDANILVPDRSELIIKSKWMISNRFTVRTVGRLKSPSELPYYQNMRLSSALFLSDGFTDDAFTGTIEVSRINPKDTLQSDRFIAKIIKVDGVDDLDKIWEQLDFALEPYDQIYVRQNPFFKPQRTVSISGEIKFPGSYPLQNKDERLSFMIDRAGGLLSTAFPEGATLFRANDNIGQIAINFKEVLENPGSPQNIILQPGDRINIPERIFTVGVEGAVAFETNVLFEAGEDLSYYIENAGGYSEDADENRVYVVLPNGITFNPNKGWFQNRDIISGSKIVVPFKLKEDEIDWKEWITLGTSTVTSIVTLILLVDRISN